MCSSFFVAYNVLINFEVIINEIYKLLAIYSTGLGKCIML